MRKLFLDFETFWSDEYTLKKMTPIEYVLDSRFESLGCAFHIDDGPGQWIEGPELPKYFSSIDWSDIYAISHNAAFDMVILGLRYDTRPARYGCTLSMARNWLSPETGSVSLAACAKRYNLPPKMDTVHKTKGLGYAALTQMPDLHAEVMTYGVDDCDKCRFLFNRMLADGFPEGELDVIDWVVRMAAQPQLEVDANIVAAHLNAVVAKKQALLDNAGMESRDNLMSDDKLAGILTMLGVDPVPRKISKTTGQEKWAFAKTDKAFTDLLEHENPDVQAVVAARLGHKTTIEETRTQRFLNIAKMTSGMPVPLKYSGAHTHRFSGDWNLNLQNLPRKGELRKALRAPSGYKVVSVDASQIEARINAVISGQWDLVEDFASGVDVYSQFAEQSIYHYPVTKDSKPRERFVGKTAILSLGYGSSAPVFQNMCRIQGDVKLSDVEAQQIVNAYRNRFPAIVDNWRTHSRITLPALCSSKPDYECGPVRIMRERILLPNGNSLRYIGLSYDTVDGLYQWTYKRGDRFHKIYGAKIVENIVQALAFVHIVEVAVRVMKMTEGLLWPAHQVHDELVYVVPDHLAEQLKTLVVGEMSKPPKWLPDAPFAAEGKITQTYGG